MRLALIALAALTVFTAGCRSTAQPISSPLAPVEPITMKATPMPEPVLVASVNAAVPTLIIKQGTRHALLGSICLTASPVAGAKAFRLMLQKNRALGLTISELEVRVDDLNWQLYYNSGIIDEGTVIDTGTLALPISVPAGTSVIMNIYGDVTDSVPSTYSAVFRLVGWSVDSMATAKSMLFPGAVNTQAIVIAPM